MHTKRRVFLKIGCQVSSTDLKKVVNLLLNFFDFKLNPKLGELHKM
jgi:hypothetical protein